MFPNGTAAASDKSDKDFQSERKYFHYRKREKNLVYLKEQGVKSYIKLQTHEKMETKAYKEDIGKYYNMMYMVEEDNHYYRCHDGRRLEQIRSIQTEGHFGDIKENENFRRFNYRSSEKVCKEFMLYAIGRNINKYHRFLNGGIKKYGGKASQDVA